MNSGTLAKIFGWLQFGVQAFGQVATNPTPLHGWASWVVMLSSLAGAVGIHAASNSGPNTPATK